MASAAPSGSNNVVPDVFDTRVLPFEVIDHQLSDRFNFDLDENTTGAFSAVLTGAIMLLLTDIIYCVAVRARSATVSSRSIQRSHLLSRTVNPVHLFQSTGDAIKRSFNTTFNSKQQQRTAKTRRTSLTTLSSTLIIALGLLLILLDVMFIFLSTTSTSVPNIDKRNLRSFFLRDDGTDRSLNFTHYLNIGCASGPITQKAYFVPQATHIQCAYQDSKPSSWRNASVAHVRFGMNPYLLTVTVTLDSFSRTVEFMQAILLANTTEYFVVNSMSADNVRSVIPRAFRRRSLQAKELGLVETPTVYEGFRQDSGWAVDFEIDLAGHSPPDRFVAAAGEVNNKENGVSNASLAWNLYLSNVSLGTVQLEGEGRGAVEIAENIFLDNGDDALVLFQHPILNLTALLIILSSLLAAWFSLSVIFGWKSTVDNRVAWVWLFDRSLRPGGLSNSADRVIDLEDTYNVELVS